MGRDPRIERRRGPGGRPAALMLVCERPAPLAVRTLELGAPDYPAALAALRDAPRRLFVRGGALGDPARSVAIVGARAATSYGRTLAERLARDLAAHGVTVVSGLARGIDAAAHEGALAGGGRTLAVLASAVDQVTPATHAALARRVEGAGALVSEVATGGPFGRGAFVKRNRIIAALSAATVVVEAGATSGALATAEAARALGRALFAVPADVDRPGAQGTLALLRAGARVCADAGDVLAALAPPAAAGEGAAGVRLRAQLSLEPASIDTLALAAGLAPGEALALLLQFQWSGLAVSHPGGRWSARG